LEFQQLGVGHIRIDPELRPTVGIAVRLPRVRILDPEGTHDAPQQHAAIHPLLAQRTLSDGQWRARRQMKDKVTEESNGRADVEGMMQGGDL